MRRRRNRRSRRLPGRLDLPGGSASGIERIRKAVTAPSRTALDVVDASERAATAREPGRARLALRFSVTAAIVAALFAVLVVRLWSIQVINVASARTSALATTTRVVQTPAPRGAIEARGGQLLAGDVSELVVLLKTQIEVDAKSKVASRVANAKTEENLATLVPGLTVADIKAKLDNEQYGPYQPVPIASVSPAIAATIEENKGDFPGVEVQSQYVRTYPQNDLAAQMLGYLGPIPSSELTKFEKLGYQQTDWVGVNGLEEQYESALHGKPGKQVLEVDPAGNPVRTTSSTAAVPGDTVVLNMDLGLEQKLTNALTNQIICLRSGCDAASGAVPADWGAAVVLGPKGQVLALASVPSYNDNEWVGGISEANYLALEHEEGEPLNDYAIAGDQPPGSTFKLATATAALDDGLLAPYQTIDDPGYFDLPGQAPLQDAPGDAALGWIDVSTALTASDDVFFYTLGAEFWDQRQRYGETPIQNMAAKYGFGQPSGIDLPGEESGWVDSPQIRRELHKLAPAAYPSETWYLGDNVEMAFGQGETVVTPLEEAEAYSTFADGGTRYAPEMVAEIVSASGKVLKTTKPKVKAHVSYSPGAYQAMLSGFEGAVQDTNGTAYQDFQGFNFSTWNLAGKTGTADVAANSSKQPTAWFVAFGGPKDDPAERYTVAVEIDQAGYGADAAAPVARDIFNYLYNHHGSLPALHASNP